MGALIVFVLSMTDSLVSQVLTMIHNGAVSPFFIAVVALAFAVVLRLGKVERFLFRS